MSQQVSYNRRFQGSRDPFQISDLGNGWGSYTFDPPRERKRYRRYRYEELSRMTTMQLIDICEREDIIHAAVDRLDSEELIHLILQFRGNRTPHLILKELDGGQERLEHALRKTRKREIPHKISIPGKIVAYRGLDTNFFDSFTMPYMPDLDGVNAAIMDNQDKICAIWQVQSYPGKEVLYLTRSGKLPCRPADVRDYRLALFPQELSDLAFQVYTGDLERLPPEVRVYIVPLLDFLVLDPVEVTMPLAVDFGTSNTAAGFYMDNYTYNKIKDGVQQGRISPGAVNYVRYITPEGETVPILPTVIGVERIENGKAVYNIGHDAEKMIVDGYFGEGFCVFYDIKRWVGDYNQMEELSDQSGHQLLVPRKEIIRAFLQFIIENAQQRFKCIFKSVYLSYPVKQRARFISLYRDILPDTIEVLGEDMVDEGVSVLYSTIARIIDSKEYSEGQWYQALIVDCGGGTTDLSTCRFRITNERVAYNIQIETAYENGDTDFGGNNLTFRIMQLLKVALAREITGAGVSLHDIAAGMDVDIYRMVEDQGVKDVYKVLDEAYAAAESVIPTRFKEYEFKNRDEYYMVRNNLYFLFTLAEKIKKEFFANPQILQVTIGNTPSWQGDERSHIYAPRWKLAARVKGKLGVQKEFPDISLNTVFVKTVLHGDIYDIIHRFFERLYESGELSGYQIINLTGQSCKIDIFRDSLKEYLPGKLMRGRREKGPEDYRLKLTCLDGAIRYISDKRLGYAKVEMQSSMPSLPYELRAFTHSGEEVVMLRPLSREQRNQGSISRSLGSVELRLHLLNTRGEEKHVYFIHCAPETFKAVTYEDIHIVYEEMIPQAEVDVIDNDEVRYFVWTNSGAWGFSVVPVSRKNQQLYIGEQQVLPFEDESWIVNYFDGTW